MNKRDVKFSTLINLIKSKRPFSILGIVFTLSSILIILPSVIFMINAFVQPHEKYDFEKIEKNGVEKEAKITYITDVDNVSINGKHPKLISYEFEDNGQIKADKFETMELEKTADYTVGKSIKIKTFENQSKIKDLESFSFPAYLFYLFPLTFFIIGIIFSLVGVVPALKNYELYKNGIVREAKVLSLTANSGMPITNSGQSVLVNYCYQGRSGNMIYGKSSTTDFSILNEKKPEDTIKIFVSEKDENSSCLIPKSEAIKNNWRV